MKIDRSPIETYTGRIGRYDGNEFFRGQHPDTRSNKEFLKVLKERGLIREVALRNRKPVRCQELDLNFKTMADCEKYFGLSHGSLRKYLKGTRKKILIRGYTFELINGGTDRTVSLTKPVV